MYSCPASRSLAGLQVRDQPQERRTCRPDGLAPSAQAQQRGAPLGRTGPGHAANRASPRAARPRPAPAGMGAVGSDWYLRIWASCRPPPPRGRRQSRSPAGPSDGAPCSPSHRDPAGRTGRSSAAATAAAPWPLPGEGRKGGKAAARGRAQARRPCRSCAPAISAA